MDKYPYEITYDLQADAWNWLDAHNPFSGQNWRAQLIDQADIDLYDKLAELPDAEAEIYINRYLSNARNNTDVIAKFSENLQSRLTNDFSKACEAIEKITGKKLFLKKYLFLLTTFPRLPYNNSNGTGEIFVYATLNPKANDPLLTIMHEILHFQFHGYWEEGLISQGLSGDNIEILKEALTVVLDEELIPLIQHTDDGYEQHKQLCEQLHQHWKKHHDFNQLIIFGTQLISNA